MLVINPRTCGDRLGANQRELRGRLSSAAEVVAEFETSGDDTDSARMAELVRGVSPSLVVAVGGDGTLSEVVKAVMVVKETSRPDVAVLPYGTANNVARSFNIPSCRRDAGARVQALNTALHGRRRPIDLGQANGTYFVGSFALGMDADILRMRNALMRRFGSSGFVRGYPAYLWSCAVNLCHSHGARARFDVSDAVETLHAYNVLVTNTSLYAGEFRFTAEDSGDDGYLDVQIFSGALDYVRRYSGAWVRHLRACKGEAIRAAPAVRQFRNLAIRFDRTVGGQIDGELFPSARTCTLQVAPRALRLRVPA